LLSGSVTSGLLCHNEKCSFYLKFIPASKVNELTNVTFIQEIYLATENYLREHPEYKPKMTLADAPTVLDMSSELPASFEHVDAASEGVSNKDLGLGAAFSEVEVFKSNELRQEVTAYFAIIESREERAVSDTIFRDEERLKSVLLEDFRAASAKKGLELVNATVEVTHPNVGDLSVLVSGECVERGVSVGSLLFGYDFLEFKINKVYVTVRVARSPVESPVPLVIIAEGIVQRIGRFSQ